jgi:predicted DNA-binding transcriptional regulator AlpA
MRDDAKDIDAILNQAVIAEWLGVTTKALEAWRYRGGGPPFIRVGGKLVRYRRGDVLAWLESRRRSSTSDRAERNCQ